MKAVIVLSGGQGKQLMSATIAKELKGRYDKIYICGAYRWWGAMLAHVDPSTFVELNPQILHTIAPEVMKHPEEWDWLTDNVYQRSDFILRKTHFFEELRKMWNLPEGEIYPPQVATDSNLAQLANAKAAELGRFVIFCRRGGGAAIVDPQGNRPQPAPEEIGLLREYPEHLSRELVQKLKKRGLRVLQCKLQQEQLIEGCEVLPQEMPMPYWSELAKAAEAVVTIDSCLMHVAAANAKKMVVIWRETSPTQFGYTGSHIVNLLPHDYTPFAPLMSGIPDTPICEPATPDEIILEL